VSNHRIIDRRVKERLVDFFLENFLSLFEYRDLGLKHSALPISLKFSLYVVNELLKRFFIDRHAIAGQLSQLCHNERLATPHLH